MRRRVRLQQRLSADHAVGGGRHHHDRGGGGGGRRGEGGGGGYRHGGGSVGSGGGGHGGDCGRRGQPGQELPHGLKHVDVSAHGLHGLHVTGPHRGELDAGRRLDDAGVDGLRLALGGAPPAQLADDAGAVAGGGGGVDDLGGGDDAAAGGGGLLQGGLGDEDGGLARLEPLLGQHRAHHLDVLLAPLAPGLAHDDRGPCKVNHNAARFIGLSVSLLFLILKKKKIVVVEFDEHDFVGRLNFMVPRYWP